MMTKIFSWAILGGMIMIGLLFGSNIYVLGDTASAIHMHDDLPATASPLLVDLKVIITFITGMLYLIAAFSIISKNRNLALAGVLGFALFDGFYILEIAMWSDIRPQIWTYFVMVGGISLLFGIYCWRYWKAGRTSTARSVA